MRLASNPLLTWDPPFCGIGADELGRLVRRADRETVVDDPQALMPGG